jgi:1-acyl-sn-glycerol-3-phosphate acyltransferase
MKRELLRIPLYGWYSRKMRMIPVDRSGGAAALRAMRQAARAARDARRQLLIFPEGTRRRPGAAPDYKPGVAGLYAQLDCDCIPVALTSGLYWARGSWLRRPGRIVVEFLEPIRPGLSRPLFMQRLEEAVETATNRLLEEAGAA